MFGVKKIQAVKVLGIRTAEETKVLATYNSSVYCILVIYNDGSRELLELPYKKMGQYVPYIIV